MPFGKNDEIIDDRANRSLVTDTASNVRPFGIEEEIVEQADPDPAWYDVHGKVDRTVEGMKNKLRLEADATARGEQPLAAGAAWSVGHGIGTAGRATLDVLSPLWDNPPVKAIRDKVGEAAGAVGREWIEQNKDDPAAQLGGYLIKQGLNKAEQFQQEHPLASARIGSGIDALDVVPAAGISAAGAKVLKKTPRMVGEVARGSEKLLGATAEGLSDVPSEALKAYGWGTSEAAKNIRKYAGKQDEVGRQILEHLDNIDEKMPEKEIVNKTLAKMPDVNIGNTVDALLRSKEEIIGTPTAAAGNKQIDRMIQTLIDAADESGNIPAQKFRQVRIQYDNDVASAFGKDIQNGVEKAGIAARNQMMDDLLTTAEKSGNPEYAAAMQAYAKKLQAVDKIKMYIGSSPEVRQTRIAAFVNNVFNANKQDAREALAGLSGVVDDDLLQKAKYVALAKQIGTETGAPGLVSPTKTGSHMKATTLAGGTIAGLATGNIPLAAGSAAGLALASPASASRVLATVGGVADKLAPRIPRKIADDVPTLRPAAIRRPLSSATRSDLYQRAGIAADNPDADMFAGLGELMTKKEKKAAELLGATEHADLPPEAFGDVPGDEDMFVGLGDLMTKREKKAAELMGATENTDLPPEAWDGSALDEAIQNETAAQKLYRQREAERLRNEEALNAKRAEAAAKVDEAATRPEPEPLPDDGLHPDDRQALADAYDEQAASGASELSNPTRTAITQYNARKEFFGPTRKDVDFASLPEEKKAVIRRFIEDVNTIRENDIGRWRTQYGEKGFPDVDVLTEDDFAQWINEGPATQKQLIMQIGTIPKNRVYGKIVKNEGGKK